MGKRNFPRGTVGNGGRAGQKGSSGNCGGLDHEVSVFISLFAQRNEPAAKRRRKCTRVTCPAVGGIPCAPRCCRGFANSAFASNSANPLFGSLSGARLRANGNSPICPAAPRRRGREKTREVSEDSDCLRAKPEFFRVPLPARSKGSPQGQDWLGCLFLVSSFGHAKEERENRRKASPPSPEFLDEPKKRGAANRPRPFGDSLCTWR